MGALFSFGRMCDGGLSHWWRFPKLVLVSYGLDAMIADYAWTVGGEISWNPILRRQLQDWELELFFFFFFGVVGEFN